MKHRVNNILRENLSEKSFAEVDKCLVEDLTHSLISGRDDVREILNKHLSVDAIEELCYKSSGLFELKSLAF